MGDGTDDLKNREAVSVRRKRELLTEAGGALTAEEVASALGFSLEDVERARVAGQLLAVALASGERLYPMLQFGVDGKPLSGLEAVLRAFRVADPWQQLSELLAPDPALESRSIFSILREQGEMGIPDAVAAAREVG